MKIKKYQNPSGTLTPEREAEIRAEQQAALNELWEKRNAYAEQEEQERKQQLKEEMKRVTEEYAAKTAHLDNGSSATDWYYALQDDPQKRAEWDRGAKLTTKAGLSVATLPWTLTYGAKSLKNLYDLAKFGFTNPVGKTAAKKALFSTLGGEVIYQGSELGKQNLNNSSIGGTTFNKEFAQPFLTAFGIAVDPDSILGKNLAKGVVNDVAEDMLGKNAVFARYGKKDTKGFKQQPKVDVKAFSQEMGNWQTKDRYAHMVTSNAHDYHNILTTTFGPEFMEEAFPFLPEYAKGLDDKAAQFAKQAYLEDIISGDAFYANGKTIIPSGSEITRRALGKKAGFGGDNTVWLRGAPIKHLEDPRRINWALMAEPGIADKYFGTTGGTKMLGMFNDTDKASFRKAMFDLDKDKYETIEQLKLAIGSKNKQSAMELYRKLINLESRIPSGIQRLNTANSINTTNRMSDPIVELGQDLLQRVQKEGDIPLEYGLTYHIGDNAIEPLIVRDNMDIIYAPELTTVMSGSKLPWSQYIEEFRNTPDYNKIVDLVEKRIPNLSPKNKGREFVYTDNLVEAISPEEGNLGTIIRVHAPDGTGGAKAELGTVPIQVTTEDGVIKSISPKSNGNFNTAEKNVYKKFGGTIPSYLKIFKGK